ncbi:hypothetical protein ALC53_11179 [Atta colombica]|uniref:Uncharacterized protein n=1 Tax=Atta colombica TaxID=520822 RepID=A0A195B2U9_9HYME|nr:hypothetical protein ALC53_11179 [Atta colombica]
MSGRINGFRSGDRRGFSSCWEGDETGCRVINTTSSLEHAIYLTPILVHQGDLARCLYKSVSRQSEGCQIRGVHITVVSQQLVQQRKRMSDEMDDFHARRLTILQYTKLHDLNSL